MSYDQTRMLERMKEIGNLLTNPDIPEETLNHYYAELKEINAHLSAIDSERRLEVVTFSNGLQLQTTTIAQIINRSSVADFCILQGLSRAEVLERTGLGRAGVV